MSTAPLIALTGNPNSGKTALFNALTGSRQKVANYAGVTVERREGSASTASGKRLRFLDLPGAYSLNPRSPDEQITRDVLTSAMTGEDAPEVLVAVVDATHLERSLSFILELRSIKRPLVVALNMMDLAESRGQVLNLEVLSRELGVPVVPTVATQSSGALPLLDFLECHLSKLEVSRKAVLESTEARFAEVDRILSLAVVTRKRPTIWTQKIDNIVLHPVWGSLVLASLLLLLFQAVFNWASVPMDWISAGIAALGSSLAEILGEGPLKSLLVDGVIEGVGAVVIFLPQILLLFFFILLLEDSGYMARAAFVMDRVMGKAGLHGRAFIPLLSSFACAIPGIMATRTIENPRDRLATIMIAPLMACSARLPVYSLLIAAFIPNQVVWGPLRAQGLVMFGLYFGGILSAVAVAMLLKQRVLKGKNPPLLLELPTYKVPAWRNLFLGLYERARLFMRRAGTIILTTTVLLWFLASYPKDVAEDPEHPKIYHSYAGLIGRSIEPLIAPLGYDWRIGVALVPGMAAREVMVSALATTYAVEISEQEDEAANEEATQQALIAQLTGTWSIATALSLLVFYIFAPMCFATLAVTRRETNSWRWPVFMLVYMFSLAYLAAFLTYQVTSWMMA